MESAIRLLPQSTPTGNPDQDVATGKYIYEFATPPDHFVTEYIDYAAKRTDAAYDFHEAVALGLLASASAGLRADVAQYANGLTLSSYILAIGPSIVSRKSTSLDYGTDLLAEALPEAKLSERYGSPEALVEELSLRGEGTPATFVAHELGEFMHALSKRPHLAGFAGLLCELFDGRPYTYRRTSKRRRGDGTLVQDTLRVSCDLTILAGATPESVFRRITASDVGIGLWPRFAIVWPDRKPPRRGFSAVEPGTEQLRARLVRRLARIREWARERPAVRFTGKALAAADSFARELESRAEQSTNPVMLQRLVPMLLKVSALVTIGSRTELGNNTVLAVSARDVAMATRIVGKWQAWAEKFSARVGETEFETNVQRCFDLLKRNGGRLYRYQVARAVNLPARVLDEIETTLFDRRLIAFTEERTRGRPAVVWMLQDDS